MPSKTRILNAYSGTTYPEALKAMKGLDVVIVSGFGRSVKELDVLRTVAMQNQSLTFLVGTQNWFTSPAFIKAGRALARELKNFEFIVDFRVSDSVHYKLTLAGRDGVILGSSNFTQKGLRGETDLMGRFVDRDMVTEVKRDLVRVRGQPGVLSSLAPEFTKALRSYTKAASEVAELAQLMRKAGGTRNPFKKTPPRVPTLTEWLNSDDAEAIRVFGYKHDLDAQEQKAETAAKDEAKAQSRPITGLCAFCPEKGLFSGLFLEVNGKRAKPRVYVTKVEFAGKFRNRFIVLGRRQKIDALGFSPTPQETAELAKAVLDKSEGRLSINEMREALGMPFI